MQRPLSLGSLTSIFQCALLSRWMADPKSSYSRGTLQCVHDQLPPETSLTAVSTECELRLQALKSDLHSISDATRSWMTPGKVVNLSNSPFTWRWERKQRKKMWTRLPEYRSGFDKMAPEKWIGCVPSAWNSFTSIAPTLSCGYRQYGNSKWLWGLFSLEKKNLEGNAVSSKSQCWILESIVGPNL